MSVRFVGNCEFDDCCQPIPSKNEWGVDVLTRRVRGRADKLKAYLDALKQGDTYSAYPGFYLQTWSSDENPIFPTVTLTYKGLLNGIPDPFIERSTSERNGSVTVERNKTLPGGITTNGTPVLTYDFLYISERVTERRITNSDKAPSATVAVQQPVITSSRYTVANATSGGGAPLSGQPNGADLTIQAKITGRNSTPIFGTPYFEWQIVAEGLIS